MGRTGSIAAHEKDSSQVDPALLIERGRSLEVQRGRPAVGLLNANRFAYGIANLGWQCVAEHLLDSGIDVLVAFADTIGRRGRAFLNSPDLTPLDMDVIGVSVPFEDTYLDVPRLLRAAGLPVLASQRGPEHPLVVLGGMAMINPLPLAPFANVVVVGEGRAAMREIVLRRAGAPKGRRFDREQFLVDVADVPGTYVPRNYRIVVDDDGYVDDFECRAGPRGIRANVVLDMNRHPITSQWTSPYATYSQDDYFSVMAAMGCHKKCPFCVVGHVQVAPSGRAVTIDQDRVIELALRRRREYGTSLVKIFFSSAFSPDDGDIKSRAIKELLRALHAHGFQARVGSLNVRQADDELFHLLSLVGQGEVTLAPETVEELRPSLGKAYISDERLHELAAVAGRYGLDLNIYSLGCLPGEQDGHAVAYAGLIRSLRRALGSGGTLYVHYNPAFRKAQTPYQYFGNASPAQARHRYRLLRGALEGEPGIDWVSVIDDPMVYYQPVLALGDDNSARVVEALYPRALVREADWVRAFRDLGLDDTRYFTAKDPDRTLPWEHIGYVQHDRMKRRARALMKVGRQLELKDFADIEEAAQPQHDAM